MNQETFLAKKTQWLQEVSDQCHEFALDFNKDFYVFQTPCDIYNPSLLIIGINPGGGKSYSEYLEESGKSKRSAASLLYDTNILTSKPAWEKELKLKGNDVMRERFARVFTQANALDELLKSAVMMNMIYFNTEKEKGLKDIPVKARDSCVKKTIEFIEILNPNNIVFITSSKINLSLCNVTDLEVLGNNIKKGELNHREVYTIPHYSYYGAYGREKATVMGNALSEVLI